MSDHPTPGNIAYGLNPKDPHQKVRPAIVLRVTDEDDPLVTVIFGQTYQSGEGPSLYIDREDRRSQVHGYFYVSSIQALPLSHFEEIRRTRLPKDIWRRLHELFAS